MAVIFFDYSKGGDELGNMSSKIDDSFQLAKTEVEARQNTLALLEIELARLENLYVIFEARSNLIADDNLQPQLPEYLGLVATLPLGPTSSPNTGAMAWLTNAPGASGRPGYFDGTDWYYMNNAGAWIVLV